MESPNDQPAPQHSLKEAVIPVKVDLTEANRQLDAFEERLSKLGVPDAMKMGGGQEQSQKSPIGDSETLVKILLVIQQRLEEVTAEIASLRDAIEENTSRR